MPPMSARPRHALWKVGVIGFLAGLAPDLDVLIRSEQDPLLYLEYHRQFTHSLIFIPIGGAIAALAPYLLFRKSWALTYPQAWLYCSLGWATHGLLDAATSYGTQLFWPFSDTRVAGNLVSIIDPLFTLPVLILGVLAMVRNKIGFARMALVWAAAYLGAGAWQNGGALARAEALAVERGHQAIRIDAKPTFANLLVWKTLYETADGYYIDAVRVGWRPRVFGGVFAARLDASRDFPWLDQASQQARDIERFRWFSDGYIARNPERPNEVVDLRYSLVPNRVAPLWSLVLRPGAGRQDHAGYVTNRGGRTEGFEVLWRMALDLPLKE